LDLASILSRLRPANRHLIVTFKGGDVEFFTEAIAQDSIDKCTSTAATTLPA
jgi:hypothetical protein